MHGETKSVKAGKEMAPVPRKDMRLIFFKFPFFLKPQGILTDVSDRALPSFLQVVGCGKHLYFIFNFRLTSFQIL